jgi:ubiquinone biosynthesis protein UbiJ
MQSFHGAIAGLESIAAPAEALDRVRGDLAAAVVALQFQDMASQLIAHTQQRLRNTADRIACDAMGDDGDGMAIIEAAPLRPNPVTQDEMDAGSVELF